MEVPIISASFLSSFLLNYHSLFLFSDSSTHIFILFFFFSTLDNTSYKNGSWFSLYIRDGKEHAIQQDPPNPRAVTE